MHHIFLPPEKLHPPLIIIDGADFHHLAHVLRVREGERVVLLDNTTRAWRAEIQCMEKRSLTATILCEEFLPPEPAIEVSVAQALGKGDRFEQVLQHCTEIGATRFIPLLTTRTVVKLSKESHQEKMTRWRGVIKGATEQCHRSRMPEISDPVHFDGLLASIDSYECAILLDTAGDAMRTLRKGRSVLLVVGPEGGMTPEEINNWRSRGGLTASLCPWVLRTETAALTALSRLLG